jgi:hypothetical protein
MAARLREFLDAGRDIDAVAVYRSVGLFNDISKMYSDTEPHASFLR